VTQADRDWWLERYSLDEIKVMAGAIFDERG
jgi:hypothetical protein